MSSNISSAKILIADDEPVNRSLIQRRLEHAGYSVATAQNGREAVEKAHEMLPDIILLDVMMPVMDGLEACRLIKEDETTRDIPIIFVSARDETDVKVSALALGANDYISKPFKAEELLARIHAALRVNLARKARDQKERLPINTGIKKARDPYRLIGSALGGKYELVDYAGGGGMGAVYRALNINKQSVVAIKILKPDIIVRNPEYAELFNKEVKAVQRLKHPNIVEVLDKGTDEDISFMVMEWLEGNTLEEVITQEQLSLERLAQIFKQICSAIDFAHENNVIHLDIKPANILLLEGKQREDLVKVIDFGLARVISRESGTTVTRFRGTHQYCAPEQFGGKVSRRSDIYSLGATLYYLISGVIPFSTSYINAKIHPNLELPEIPSLTNYRSNLAIDVDHVISKALSKAPNERHKSARQLFEELSAAIS